MAASKGVLPPRPPEVATAELVRTLPRNHAALAQRDRLQKLQDELLERSLNVVDASVCFADVEPDAAEPPSQWVDQYGPEGAAIRLRIAKAAWAGAKNAPIGIKVAASVAVGIMRARATENSGPRTLNVAVVQLTAPLPEFPTQEIEVGR